MKTKLSIGAFFLFILLACGGKKVRPAFYDSEGFKADTISNTNSFSKASEMISNQEIISVPFNEKGGVKYVNVSVNGLGVEMIFDTGCSGTLISVVEANYLYQKGYLTGNDYFGNSQSQIADGSIVENMIFNIKELVIDGKIRCTDVKATVSANINAPLLLGNEVLNRVASYTIDNENQKINFKLK
jgi:predicted aspartyl protease